MAAEEAEAEADAAVDLHALERDVGGLALDDAGDVEDDDAGSYGSADDEETPADAFLSLQMVCAKNFPPDFLRDEARDAESLACVVERLEHVRLDRCGLVSLLGPGSGSGLPGSSTAPSLTAETTISSAPLRSLRNVSSLYLQKNRLVDLGGAINAETTPRLRFLALADNALAFDDTHDIVCFEKGDATKTHPLRGLETLPALMYLDCSGNVRLNGVAPLLERLPSSVAFCDFSRCALSFVDEYRPALVASFDALKQLDGVAVTRQERRDARALLGEEGDGDADRDGSESAEAEAEAEEAEEAEEAASSSSADPDASSSKPPRRARPSSNSSAAAAAAAALAMSDEDEHGSDASIEPVTEAELDAELAALERETRAARAALDADAADAVGDSDVFFSRDAGGIEPARLLERDRAANRAAARLEETRDALVDVEARVRRAVKQTREARESASGSEEV
jgi:hypothetical protein